MTNIINAQKTPLGSFYQSPLGARTSQPAIFMSINLFMQTSVANGYAKYYDPGTFSFAVRLFEPLTNRSASVSVVVPSTDTATFFDPLSNFMSTILRDSQAYSSYKLKVEVVLTGEYSQTGVFTSYGNAEESLYNNMFELTRCIGNGIIVNGCLKQIFNYTPPSWTRFFEPMGDGATNTNYDKVANAAKPVHYKLVYRLTLCDRSGNPVKARDISGRVVLDSNKNPTFVQAQQSFKYQPERRCYVKIHRYVTTKNNPTPDSQGYFNSLSSSPNGSFDYTNIGTSAHRIGNLYKAANSGAWKLYTSGLTPGTVTTSFNFSWGRAVLVNWLRLNTVESLNPNPDTAYFNSIYTDGLPYSDFTEDTNTQSPGNPELVYTPPVPPPYGLYSLRFNVNGTVKTINLPDNNIEEAFGWWLYDISTTVADGYNYGIYRSKLDEALINTFSVLEDAIAAIESLTENGGSSLTLDYTLVDGNVSKTTSEGDHHSGDAGHVAPYSGIRQDNPFLG